ncbi:MAG: VWA domain-containing protein [Candidatus Obscuribacterales bacterium]|jgi:uncharacterized protein with von Willebrand factor type A (vWA) domain|nr:VWA domain-containing protein [Candidatus Obscuribacterales bacterium]
MDPDNLQNPTDGSPNQEQEARKLRWRMVLGESAGACMGGLNDETWQKRERTIRYLYDRDNADKRGKNIRQSTTGGLEDSQLTVQDWINDVHELFPEKVVEQIEKDALEKYQLSEMVTNPEALSRAKPSEDLLRAVLRTKHLMNQEVLEIARVLVRKVVQEIMEKLLHEIRAPFIGAKDRRRRSNIRIAKNFDTRATILKNLKHYDPEKKRLFIETPIFISRVRKHNEKWQLIILLDESGSMLDNIIHASIMASVFWGIKSIRTHLIIFDTNVVDLTNECNDPVETLMKVQLGGGTDIGKAVHYGAGLVENPKNTIVILISDFFEGGSQNFLLSQIKGLIESGVTMLGLAALDRRGQPVFDHDLAKKMANLGMHVAAMTPGELAAWLAARIK